MPDRVELLEVLEGPRLRGGPQSRNKGDPSRQLTDFGPRWVA